MNFYKHHLGDYAAATSHLSWDEDCAYRRLLDQYYKREAPIPTDPKEACRWIRATSAAQRKAVESVLQEFFALGEDGWRQKRCDEEIVHANAQAETNRRIAEDREARKKARIVNEPSDTKDDKKSTDRERVVHESSTHTDGGREPPRPQTPDSTSQTPDSIRGTTSPRTPRRSKLPDGSPAPTAAVWQAYSEAYEARYRVKPVRNAAVNGVLAQLVSRLGGDAPDVARFYLRHNKSYYVGKSHSVQALLSDAEGLRTQWANGRAVTATQAQQADRTQTTFDAFAPLLAEAQGVTHGES